MVLRNSLLILATFASSVFGATWVNVGKGSYAAGSAASVAFVTKNSGIDLSTSTTVSASVSGVAAGDLIIAGVRWAGTNTTCTISDTTSSLTQLAAASMDEDGGTSTLRSRILYLLSSVRTGSVTYTVTLGAAGDTPEVFIFVYRPSGGTASTDGGNHNGSTSGTSLTSGNITTTGTTEVVVGFHAYAGFAITGTPTINGVSADQVQTESSRSSMWSSIFASTFTGGAAATLGGSDWWGASIAAFKIQ